MGSPQFAADVLAGIVKHHEVVCVVTQPDTVAGRGHQICMSAVKQFALTNGIPVLQPVKISLEADKLCEYQPDVIVTCAFGQILRQSILDVAPHGVINVHVLGDDNGHAVEVCYQNIVEQLQYNGL